MKEAAVATYDKRGNMTLTSLEEANRVSGGPRKHLISVWAARLPIDAMRAHEKAK